MKIQYDREADALYIQIRQGKAHHAVDVEDARGLTIDVDKDGMPLGIEILKASQLLGPELGRITVEDLLVTHPEKAE